MPPKKRSPNGHLATSSPSMIFPPLRKTKQLCILSNSKLTTRRETLAAGVCEYILPPQLTYLLNNMIKEGADLTYLRKRGHGVMHHWYPGFSPTFQEE